MDNYETDIPKFIANFTTLVFEALRMNVLIICMIVYK